MTEEYEYEEAAIQELLMERRRARGTRNCPVCGVEIWIYDGTGVYAPCCFEHMEDEK